MLYDQYFITFQALLNLGSSDPSLRSAAYNLLCALTQNFDLKIEGQLLETAGLKINLKGHPTVNIQSALIFFVIAIY